MILSLIWMFMFNNLAAQDRPPVDSLRSRIESRLAHEPGHFAVAFKDLTGGASFSIRDRDMIHAASTMKIAVMIETFRQADRGLFHLDDSLLIKNEFKSIVDGQPFSIDVVQDKDDPMTGRIGQWTNLRDLIEHMITVSSNLATNLLIDKVGASHVQVTVRRLGAEQMLILRGVEDNLAYQKGLNNRTDAHDLLILLQAIAEKKAASEKACDEMIEVLLRQKFRTKIPALLPPEVRVANKTGSITAIDHDAAIVYLPDGRRYILVVLSSGIEDQQKSSAIIAEISLQVYHWMKENQSREH
jgi:beta-lactamase class A